MKKSMAIVLLLLISVSAFARIFRIWKEAEMQKASQLIVIGKVVNVRDSGETNAVMCPPCKVLGVEATFAVSKVLKGDFTNNTVVLHYYRFDPSSCSLDDGPSFLNLTPTNTNQFLLYLVSDGASRYAPVSGQIDPSLDAVRVFRQQ
jgi:hypothetical protein